MPAWHLASLRRNRFLDAAGSPPAHPRRNHAALRANLGADGYRRFEDDDRPFELRDEGFRRLDRVVDTCARHGILDLNAAPGHQNGTIYTAHDYALLGIARDNRYPGHART